MLAIIPQRIISQALLTEDSPAYLPFLGFKWRKLEDIAQDSRVEYFDPNVAVEQRCNNRDNEVDGVAERLKAVCRMWYALQSVSISSQMEAEGDFHTLKSRIVSELSLP